VFANPLHQAGTWGRTASGQIGAKLDTLRAAAFGCDRTLDRLHTDFKNNGIFHGESLRRKSNERKGNEGDRQIKFATGRPYSRNGGRRNVLDLLLEAIVQAELDLPLRRANGSDLTKAPAVRDSIVGVPIAGNVEHVKEVRSEAKDMFAPHMKILEE